MTSGPVEGTGDHEKGLHPGPDWRVWVFAILLMTGFLLVVRYGGLDPASSRPALRDPGLGQADLHWLLLDRDGHGVDLESFRGKTIFLNEWATWCSPCVAELPSIERLAANPRLKDVVFLAISQEPIETIRRFAESRKLTVPVYQSAGNPPSTFFTEAIPATFIIAPSGRIAAHQMGAANWDDPAVISILEQAAQK